MSIETWPKAAFGGKHPTIVKAEARAVDESPKRYEVLFHDSSGNQLTVQLPDTALRKLVEEGMALFGLAPKPKVQSAGKKRSKN